MCYWKRGENERPGLAYSTPSLSSHTDSMASTGQHAQHANQVKLLKPPVSFSSRPGGHILFSTGTITWTLSLSPPLA